jgi:signal-transduction protein with cAMP-binding, CBS, and nucleotidyltransferase domain
MNSLFSHLPPLSPESKQAMENILQTFEYKKNEIILKEGSTCHYLYFVASGATRTFYYKDGKDITDWISMENTFACSIVSFITRKPDIRGIEALEDCTLYALPHAELEQL